MNAQDIPRITVVIIGQIINNIRNNFKIKRESLETKWLLGTAFDNVSSQFPINCFNGNLMEIGTCRR